MNTTWRHEPGDTRAGAAGLPRSFLYLFAVLFGLGLLVPVILYAINWNASRRNAARIEGTWSAAFTLEKSYGWQPRPATTVIRGSIGLALDPARRTGIEGMDYAGQADFDFAPFEFRNEDRRIVGKMVTRDTILLIVSPSVIDGQIKLRGRVGRDEIKGHWWFSTEADLGDGTFVLRREHR